ncbi:hypothetical protein C1I95_03125 [Micromonospora craterilacus]|uniref:Integral membrane protein n=1 Tax=Micromonospora craterilacus TaxID=1655439 RepID=A0A2W2F2S2_9ACTN|nr:hypothetical protein [Micromonospora craterilacus]PZG23619.1 hypothetical protein C1I95_03125 [Micromonospora craterilacus]
MPLAAIALVVLLAVLAAFQVALALGAPLGRFAWGGQHEVLPLPLRVGSAVAIVVYAIIAVIALDRAELIDVLAGPVARVTMWILVGYFALSIAPNALSRSRSERNAMVPVSIALTALALLVAVG